MKLKLLIVALFCSVLGWGQTNPMAQVLPYSQDFISLTGSTTTYPAGWQGWTITGSLAATYPTTAPNGNQALAGTTNTSTAGHVGDFNGKMGIMSTGSAMKSICLSINTTSNTNIQVSFKAATQRTENTRQNELGLQYRIGNTGTFTNVSGSEYLNQMTPTNTSGTGSVNVQTINVTLPVACENQAEVQIRWVIREVSGSGNRPGFSIDDVSVSGTPASSNTITTDTAITGSPFCVSASTGASVSVPFTSVGTFNAGNVYTAQLSNAAGSFASPVSIGTVTSTANSGTIAATIPAGTAAGTGYRIRVVSSNPVVTGTDNTVNLTVQIPAAITTQPSTTVQNLCQGSAATVLSVAATGTILTYQWYSNTTATTSGGTPVGTSSASYTPVTTATGTLYYYCVVSAACGASVTSNVSGAVNVTAIPSAPAGTINVSANPSCGAATLTYSAPNANIYWQTTATGTSTANPTTSLLHH